MTVFRNRIFKEVIKVKLSQGVQTSFYMTGVLTRRRNDTEFSLSLCTYTGKRLCEDIEKRCLLQAEKRSHQKPTLTAP